MKLIIFSALAAFANADLEASIGSALREQRKSLDKAAYRNLNLILGSNIDTIKNYGCWCNFDQPVGTGKGHPVDETDALCRTLSEGYQCAMMDVETATGVDNCVPWEVSYNAGTGGGIPGLVTNCEALNADLCAQFACMVEGSFSLNIITNFLTFGAIDPANNHNNGGFDHRASCPVQSGSQTELRECCGELPFRFPFKPVNKECCGAQTYDPSLMDCCADNIPRFSCI